MSCRNYRRNESGDWFAYVLAGGLAGAFIMWEVAKRRCQHQISITDSREKTDETKAISAETPMTR